MDGVASNDVDKQLKQKDNVLKEPSSCLSLSM